MAVGAIGLQEVVRRLWLPERLVAHFSGLPAELALQESALLDSANACRQSVK